MQPCISIEYAYARALWVKATNPKHLSIWDSKGRFSGVIDSTRRELVQILVFVLLNSYFAVLCFQSWSKIFPDLELNPKLLDGSHKSWLLDHLAAGRLIFVSGPVSLDNGLELEMGFGYRFHTYSILVGRKFPDRELNPGPVGERHNLKFLNHLGAGEMVFVYDPELRKCFSAWNRRLSYHLSCMQPFILIEYAYRHVKKCSQSGCRPRAL